MDVDRAVRSVLAWLRRTKGVVVRTDWLTACVEWIANEEVIEHAGFIHFLSTSCSILIRLLQGTDVSHSALQELVYQQWLHSDLRDTVDTGSLPSPLVTQPGSVHITGSHIVQVQLKAKHLQTLMHYSSSLTRYTSLGLAGQLILLFFSLDGFSVECGGSSICSMAAY